MNCHENIGPGKIGPAGPILDTKTGLDRPILVFYFIFIYLICQNDRVHGTKRHSLGSPSLARPDHFWHPKLVQPGQNWSGLSLVGHMHP